ncbi:MAG: ROK family protein [Bacteroidota bacterium]
MELLGIDIGGTGIKGAIVDTKKGELITERYRIDTPQPPTPEAIIHTVHKIIKEFNWKRGIGCGFPAAVKHEIVKTAANIDDSWIGMNAAEEISKVTGCPAHVVNDVDAAGYAEMKFGAGKKHDGLVMVIAAGTGIGTAIFSEQILVPNTELGHLRLHGIDAEKYAANSVRKEEELPMDVWAKRFNEYLNRIVELFWPDLIILGGGISKKFEEYEKYFDMDTKIVPASMRNEAGIVGAALAAKHEGIR